MLTRCFVVVTLLWGALFARDAGAYCLTKYGTATKWASWPSQPIKYRISSNLTDQATITAIDNAFKTWDAVACSSLTFSKDAAFPVNTSFQTTGFINVFWVTKASELPSGMQDTYFAYHFISFNATGELNGASVALNAFKYKWNTTGGAADTFDVQDVVTYYAGLLIGLGKSKTPNTVMTDDVGYNQTYKKTLTQDDINALSAVYQGTCAAPPAPDASCGVTPPPPGEPASPKKDSGPPPPPTEAGPVKKDTGVTPPTGDGKVPPVTEKGTPVPVNEAGIPIGVDGGGTGCTTNAQCAGDEICSIEGKCVKTGGGGGDSGCGCRVGGLQAASAPLALALIALAFVLVLSRRRR